jgi:hypothetical protein
MPLDNLTKAMMPKQLLYFFDKYSKYIVENDANKQVIFYSFVIDDINCSTTLYLSGRQVTNIFNANIIYEAVRDYPDISWRVDKFITNQTGNQDASYLGDFTSNNEDVIDAAKDIVKDIIKKDNVTKIEDDINKRVAYIFEKYPEDIHVSKLTNEKNVFISKKDEENDIEYKINSTGKERVEYFIFKDNISFVGESDDGKNWKISILDYNTLPDGTFVSENIKVLNKIITNNDDVIESMNEVVEKIKTQIIPEKDKYVNKY